MLLKKGKKNIGKNISKMMHEGREHDQAVAIAMSVAGESRGGKKRGKKSSGNIYTETEKHTKRRG